MKFYVLVFVMQVLQNPGLCLIYVLRK